MALSDGILKGWQHWRKDHGKGQEERQGTPSPGRAGHSGKRASDAMPTGHTWQGWGPLHIFTQ